MSDLKNQRRKFPPANKGFFEMLKSFVYFFMLFLVFHIVSRITSKYNSDSTFLITFFFILGIAIYSTLIIHKQFWWGLISLIPFWILIIFASSITLSSEETGYVGLGLIIALPFILLYGLIMFFSRYYYQIESKVWKLLILLLPFLVIFLYGCYQFIIYKKLTFSFNWIF